MAQPDASLAAKIAEIAAAAKARALAGGADRIAAQRRAEHRRKIAELTAEGLSRKEAEARLERDGEEHNNAPKISAADLLSSAETLREFVRLQTLPLDGPKTATLLALRPVVQWESIVSNLDNEQGRSGLFAKQVRHILAPLEGKVTLYEIFKAMGTGLFCDWEQAASALREGAQAQLMHLARGDTHTDSFDSHRQLEVAALAERLVRSGATLLRKDATGRTPLFAAAEGGNYALLAVFLHAAPVGIALAGPEGTSILDVLSLQHSAQRGEFDDSALPSALIDAVLHCMALCPEHVIKQVSAVRDFWLSFASGSGAEDLLAFCSASHGSNNERVPSVAAALRDASRAAEHDETAGATTVRQVTRRMALLRSLVRGHEGEVQAAEPEVLRLRAEHAEMVAQKAQEEAAKRVAALEEELLRMRQAYSRQEEELLALKAAGSVQAVAKPTERSASSAAAAEASPATPGASASGPAEKPAPIPAALASGNQPQQANPQEEQQLIENIARARNVGSDPSQLAPDVHASIIGMKASLAAAVDTIAKDLYESEAHFMQELLQNADDNKYVDGAVPEIRFSLTRHVAEGTAGGDSPTIFFIASNNELGFSEADVRAITDISRSSKKKNGGTTTGYKGVGWKSVFRVCDSPVVLSGGWRFKFSSEGLGLLTPTWVEHSEYSALPPEAKEEHDRGRTVFCLPLRDPSAVASIEAEMLAMEAEPVRLLFLRKIRSIALHGLTGHRVRLQSSGYGAIQMESSRSDAANGAANHESVNFHVERVKDVAVAMPLGYEEPPPQRLFAFLPIRCVGFHFAAQAPFDLTTSRADLHHTSKNAALRDCIAPAFLQACETCAEVGASALKFLGSLPADPFWYVVRDKILSGLRSVPCVQTDDAGLVEPRHVLSRGDFPAAAWIPAPILLAACGMHFASDSNPRDTLRDLGVKPFSSEHLLLCLQCHGVKSWLRSALQQRHYSTIMSDIYSCLAEAMLDDPARLEAVAALEIFPLDGSGGGPGAAHRLGVGVGEAAEVPLGPADGLFSGPCKELPLAWQEGLVLFLHPDLAANLTAPAWQCLTSLNVVPVTEELLEKEALQLLLRQSAAGAGNGGGRRAEGGSALWSALAVLRRCCLLSRSPPRPWEEMRDALLLPSTAGDLQPPAKLSCWSFMGITSKLPSGVRERIRQLAGCGTGGSDESAAAQAWGTESVLAPLVEVQRPPVQMMLASAQDHLGWEVFLSKLGCQPASLETNAASMEMEATMQLGQMFSSSAFWHYVAASPPVLDYASMLLGPGVSRLRRLWLRNLPLRLPDDTTACVEDLFVREVFHTLGGKHLPYISELPPNTAVTGLLANLGVAVKVSSGSVVKALRWLRRREVEDIGVVADLYVALAKCGPADALSAGSAAVEEEEELFLVPGRGFLHRDDCVWKPFQCDPLQRCSQLEALSSHYERYGEPVCAALQQWLRTSAEQDASEICEALRRVIVLARGGELVMRQPMSSSEAMGHLLQASRAAIALLVKLCCSGSRAAGSQVFVSTDSAAACTIFDHFLQHRLIVVPAGESCFRLLHRPDAFWSVEESLAGSPLAELALQNHYGDIENAKEFFLQLVKIRDCLRRPHLRDLLQKYSRNGGEGGNESGILMGLEQLPVQTDRADPAPLDLDQLYSRAMARAQGCRRAQEGLEPEVEATQPRTEARARLWTRFGEIAGMQVFIADGSEPTFTLPQELSVDILRLICPHFGLNCSQLTLAYDAGGRCVSETNPLFLDLAKAHRVVRLAQSRAIDYSSVVAFWITEVAHALAHLGIGPGHEEGFLQLHAEIVSAHTPGALRWAEGQATRTAPARTHFGGAAGGPGPGPGIGPQGPGGLPPQYRNLPGPSILWSG